MQLLSGSCDLSSSWRCSCSSSMPEKLAYAVMGTTKSEKTRCIYTQADALVFVFVVLFVFFKRHAKISTTHLIFTEVTASSQTYFLCSAFSLCRFSWCTFKGASHSPSHRNPDSETTAPGITFQLEEMEKIFLVLLPTGSPSTYFSLHC